jgi:hypothetical protein
MDETNSITVEAKKQYTLQLISTISPLIYQGFKTIFDGCKHSNNNLKKFQEKLCTISVWNQDIIDNEYTRIIKTSKCEWLDGLLEAIFICNVKILTIINNNSDATFNIKVPETKKFIHRCYISAARQFYTEPHLMDDRGSVSECNSNMKTCMNIISSSIERTIIDLIPKDEIMEKCLSNKNFTPENIPDIKHNQFDSNNVQNESDDVNNEDHSEDSEQSGNYYGENEGEYNNRLNDNISIHSKNSVIKDIDEKRSELLNERPELNVVSGTDMCCSSSSSSEPQVLQIGGENNIDSKNNDDDPFFSDNEF